MNTMRLIAMTVALCLATVAIAQNGAQDSGIAPQPLDSALKEFAEKSGLQVIYVAKLAAGKNTSGAKANRSDAETLEQLLASTGLEYEFLNANTVTVQAAAEEEVASDLGNSRTRPILMAQNQTPAQTQAGAEKSDDDEEEELELERVTVTGTHIRGIAPDSSPTRTYSREDIQITGAGTAQDFIQTLTANFGGGSTEQSAFPNDINSVSNGGNSGTLGSSVNLRGLGSGGTLVLLNGHRLAPSSGIGDFVDISMIPASAIERVEVLTDGASSIYGADAVAGVVNFVLRDDFDGAEAAFRYGTVTEGDLGEFRASITGGDNWGTGNALVVYEYYSRDNLSTSDRSFSQSAPLPNDLLPRQRRHSILASASQELSSTLELLADFTFSRREARSEGTNTFGSFFPRDMLSENMNISAGGTWKITDTWFVDFSGTYSDIHNETETFEDAPDESAIDSNLWTADVKASGTLFDLPGGEVKLALGGHYRTEKFINFDVDDDILRGTADRNVYALYGEAYIPIVGRDNAIAGIERLELNVSGRFEDFNDFGSSANPKVGVLWSPVEALSLRGSYSTSFNPPPLGIIGGTRSASAVPTSFWNARFGFTAPDPSIADVVVLTVSGPGDRLEAETSRAFTAGFDFTKAWGPHDLALSMNWFDIEFENRLGTTPVPGFTTVIAAPNVAFANSELLPEGTVIFFPSTDLVETVLSDLARLIVFPGVNPLDTEIINFAGTTRNLARTLVTGFDLAISYAFTSDAGIFALGLEGTILQEFERQAAATTPVVDRLNTLHNPIDLRLRGRAGYSYNGFAANLFINYTDDYRVDNVAGAAPLDSWTTVDLALSYNTRERIDHSIFDNTTLRLSVLNVLNDDPPTAPDNLNFGIFGFDPANASPLGRFISFEVTKRF